MGAPQGAPIFLRKVFAMNRYAGFLLPLIFLATPLQADPATFDPNLGLAVSQAQLAALASPTPDEALVLAAVRFLRGIERSLQTRYRSNLELKDLEIPVLRLPIPANPNPTPFDPAAITAIFTDVANDMQLTRDALAMIPADASPVLHLDLMALWLDVDADGIRGRAEGLADIAGLAIDPRGAAEMRRNAPARLDVRFDAADVAWLAAYTHLLSGISDLVVAFDPTEVIANVQASKQTMDALRGTAQGRPRLFGDDERFVDLFAMIYGALNRKPDPARTRSAHAHFLEMIHQNQQFWALVTQETDNEAEWIPNDLQTAALGFELPKSTGALWQAVLADAEQILEGKLLIGHWRTTPAAGVNVQKLMFDPPAVDIATWIQGEGLAPYIERGPLASTRTLNLFDDMFLGNSIMFMVLLN